MMMQKSIFRSTACQCVYTRYDFSSYIFIAGVSVCMLARVCVCVCAFVGDCVHSLAYCPYGSASYCVTVCCFTFSFSSLHSMCVSWRVYEEECAQTRVHVHVGLCVCVCSARLCSPAAAAPTRDSGSVCRELKT